MTLAGCAVPFTDTSPEPDLSTADVVYLNEIRHAAVDLKTEAASYKLIEAGRATCASLGKGTTLPAAVKSLLEQFYPDLASVVAVAAIHNYCPQHTVLLTVPAT
jgi:hypothetical protein